ncbi:MAG: ACT domain-containing protein [Clostridiales bacterium]|nr:ACT domain-containing protein [Clostridiales bacterium]
MMIKQISVFLENKPGQLAELANVLADHNVDMRALSVADTMDFGILRLIVDDPDRTCSILTKGGWVSSITPVLAVEIPDRPGGLAEILNILSAHSVNLEYTYAFTSRKDNGAYMIFRVQDTEKAFEVLRAQNVKLATQEEIYAL